MKTNDSKDCEEEIARDKLEELRTDIRNTIRESLRPIEEAARNLVSRTTDGSQIA